MLHHHLPFLAQLGKQVTHFYDHAARLIEVGFMRLQRSDKKSPAGPASKKEKAARWRKSPLLIHYHIFKNAGSSFEWTLEESLGKQLRRYDGAVAGAVVPPKDIVRYAARETETKAISSHQALLPAPRIRGREVITSILIRDPIARIRSIYAFERRQHATSPGALRAKELNFKDYVAWRLSATPAMLCNYQVHFCARTQTSDRAVTNEAQLQRAIENLDRIDIVGTVERYDEWLALAQSVLSHAFPEIALRASRRNVTALNQPPTNATILDDLIQELGHAVAEKLLQCNELDMCLHQVADALLTRRLAERGIKVTLREAYASVQQDWLQKSDVKRTESR
jgi:hypothetical protein